MKAHNNEVNGNKVEGLKYHAVMSATIKKEKNKRKAEIKRLKERIQELLFAKEFQIDYILALEQKSGLNLASGYLPEYISQEINERRQV